MKESQGKVGKNALNEERMWGELLHQGPKPFKFWALTLGTGGSIYDGLCKRENCRIIMTKLI